MIWVINESESEFYDGILSFNLHLEPKVQELIQKAVEARKFAYCPYSNFAVGAALRATTGEIFTGENSISKSMKSYRLS